MSSDRQILFGGVGLTVLVAVMAWLFIWPGYRDAMAFRGRVDDLHGRIAGLQDEHRQVRLLAEQVEQAQRTVALKYKVIPASPEVAELIRKLSLPVDGVSVTDQTFTAGSAEAIEAPGLESSTLRALPLKVEMSATFESIFALLRAAESMNQLMRVSSLKVICKRDEKAEGRAVRGQWSVGSGQWADHSSRSTDRSSLSTDRLDGSPVLNASVGLEAIFDPPAGEEEGG